MKKTCFVALFAICTTIVYGQGKISFGGEIVSSYSNFKSNFAPPSKNQTEGGINSIYAIFKSRKDISNSNFSLDIGLGMGYETVVFSTFIPINELDIPRQSGFHTDIFRGQLRRNYNLAMPIGLSYKLMPYSGNKIPGIRLNLNTLHEFVLTKGVNLVAVNYNATEPSISGFFSYNDNETELAIKDYYEEYNKNYRFTTKIGIEAFYEFEKYQVSGGLNYHPFFVSPYKYSIKTQPSYSVFIAILFNK